MIVDNHTFTDINTNLSNAVMVQMPQTSKAASSLITSSLTGDVIKWTFYMEDLVGNHNSFTTVVQGFRTENNIIKSTAGECSLIWAEGGYRAVSATSKSGPLTNDACRILQQAMDKTFSETTNAVLGRVVEGLY